jgi:hypothetical protein
MVSVAITLLCARVRVVRFPEAGNGTDIMPPAMGQPINVVEKPSRTPGIARFEINRSLTGMGHERYASVETSSTTGRSTSWPAGCSRAAGSRGFTPTEA